MEKRGFTLVELAVTAIIIGILVMIGIPNMFSSINRGYALDAYRNLKIIHASQQNYAQNNPTFLNCSDLSSCNGGLGLNIAAVGKTVYKCNDPNYCLAQNTTIFNMQLLLNQPITPDDVPLFCGTNVAGTVGASNPCCLANGPGGGRCP